MKKNIQAWLTANELGTYKTAQNIVNIENTEGLFWKTESEVNIHYADRDGCFYG